jgi:FKBP-type peptidyl-prolyl cis-trans isomerase SlyD
MKVTQDSVVSIEFTLKDNEGEILDSSEGEEALEYLHGHGQLVPGLEKALEGKQKGDECTVSIPPEQGYGMRDESRIVEADMSDFEDDIEMEIGTEITAEGPNGEEIPFWISDIKENTVVLDGNHPLAGEVLNFAVKIVDVRAATAEELAHGHVHGPGHEH